MVKLPWSLLTGFVKQSFITFLSRAKVPNLNLHIHIVYEGIY